MKRQTLNNDARTGAALPSPLSRVGLIYALLGASALACGEDVSSVEDAGPADAGHADASAVRRDAGEPNVSRGPPSVPEWTGDGFLQDGEPFRIRGVCWNPVPRGRSQDGRDFAGFVDRDAALMASIGINAVRTYAPILDEQVLDTLYARGIFVIQQVYGSAFQPLRDIDAAIAATKDHPAILMWRSVTSGTITASFRS